MPKINGQIPVQPFELVRDRIGFILSDELPNQYTLSANEALNVSVYKERIVPFDNTEIGLVNVRYGRGDLNNQHQGQTDHNATYFIDCYQKAKSTSSSVGDVDSLIKLHSLIGVCRAILENPIYKTLDFAPAFIGYSQIESIDIAEPQRGDATNTTMGRLTFNVRMLEDTQLIDAILASGYDTQVKIELTDKGYKYVNNG